MVLSSFGHSISNQQSETQDSYQNRKFQENLDFTPEVVLEAKYQTVTYIDDDTLN